MRRFFQTLLPFALGVASFLFASSVVGAQVTLPNPIHFPSIDAFLLEILKAVVQYGAIVVVFFIVYAGFKFVTAQGNAEKLAEAKKMLVWVIVGAFVLLGVFVIREAICGTLNELRSGTGLPEVCPRGTQTAPPTGGSVQPPPGASGASTQPPPKTGG